MKTIKVEGYVLDELKKVQAEHMLRGYDFNLSETLAGVLAVYRLHALPQPYVSP